MNTPFLRIVWKEYRAVRGFWLALAVLGVFWQLVFTAILATDLERSAFVYGTPLVAAALFVAGCMAALFAAEREEETVQFLQNLPANSSTIAGGKLAFAGLSTLLLAAVLAVSAMMIVGAGNDRAGLATILAVFGIGAIECAAWAALCSLLSRRPLVAAVAAIAFASVATHVATGLASPTPSQAGSLATYRDAWPARLALAVVVALAAGLVSRRWLEGGTLGERLAQWSRRLGFRQRVGTEPSATTAAPPQPAGFPILGRLLWQSWCQSWWVALLFVLLGPPIVGLLTYATSLASGTSPLPWWIGLSAVLGGLLGTLVFHADQEGGRYRFFAERAEQPGLVWLSRLLFWGTAVVLMTGVIHAAAAYGLVQDPAGEALQGLQIYLQRQAESAPDAGRFLEGAMLHLLESWSHLLVIGFSILVHVGGFCIGQLCSMAVRSGVIAGFWASLTTVVFVAFAAALLAWDLQGPLVWTLVAVPASLLLATRLRMRGWLLDRSGWRAWRWPAGVVLGPVLLAIVSIPSLRTELREAHLIDPVELEARFDAFQQALASFEQELSTSADAGRRTAELYLRACDLLAGSAPSVDAGGTADLPVEVEADTPEAQRMREWIDGNAEALNLALDAASRDVCFLPPELLENDRRIEQLRALQLLVNASGGELAREGEVEQALDRHLAALQMTKHFLQFQQSPMRLKFGRIPTYNWIADWARKDGQTPEQLRRAIEAIEGRPVVMPPLSETILADFLHLRSILRGANDPSAGGLDFAGPRARLAYLAHQLPWERERALAVLDRVYTQKYFAASAVDETFARGVTSRILYRHSLSSPLPPQSTLRTTYYLLNLYRRLPDFGYLAEQIAAEEFYRRALLVNLGLAAYRLEHGDYPRLLADLVGEYLSQRPTDNLAREERTFYYHPEGLDAPLHRGSQGFGSDPSPPIPAGTPLFWSPREGHAPLGEDPRVRLHKVNEPPIYGLPQGASVFILPHDDAEDADDRPRGRRPEADDVPVDRIDAGYGGSGYGGAYRQR